MKRIFIGLGVVLVLIITALIVIPIFFKDEIKAAIDKELANSLNAEVYWNHEDLGLSLFSNFPDLTVSLDHFGIVGVDVFAGDTLLDVASLGLELDIFDLINGDMTLKGLSLDQATIFVLSLEDGMANYDIVKDTGGDAGQEEAEPEEDMGEQITMAIDHWSITESTFIYYDAGYNMFIDLENMNLEGGGDITTERFDLATELDIERVGIEYDEVKYFNGQRVAGHVVLDMNYVDYTFAFKQNDLSINDFGLHFDGSFGMPGGGIDFDLTFASDEGTFGSLLSLIPEYYAGDISDLEAEGNLQFDGSLTGRYSYVDDGMPGFRVNLRVDDGGFNYPGMPAALKEVNLHMLVESTDGTMDNTALDVKTMSMRLGSAGKVEGSVAIDGFGTPKIKANLRGDMDLASVMRAIPEDTRQGIDLSGAFSFAVAADGVYDEARERIPTFDVDLNLTNGQVAYTDYPIPMEDIQMLLTATNSSGTLNDTEIDLSRLHLNLDGEEVLVTANLRDLADYTWQASAKGGMDLDKLSRILHLEEMGLAGRLTLDMNTAGKYSDLEAERYERLPTSGSLLLTNFRYSSEDLPEEVAISKADITFNPERAAVNALDMTLGQSDLHLSGYVTNYLAYIMTDHEVLRGTLTLTSNTLDLNPFLTTTDGEETEGEATTEEEPGEESEMEVVVIPSTVNFTFNSRIGTVYYDNMTLDDVRGKIMVRNSQLILDNLSFNSLDGQFLVSGTYDTRNPADPKVVMDLDIKDISIKSAYDVSGLVQRAAPVAENMTGKFSTDFHIDSRLQSNMMPNYSTLTGSGLISIVQAALDSGPIVTGLAETAKLKQSVDNVTLEDVILSARIENGRLSVEPFTVKVGNYSTRVSGSGGLDGTLDYRLGMDVPAGAVGELANSVLGSLTGTATSGSNIRVNVGVGGTYQQPRFSLLGTGTNGTSGGSSLASQVTGNLQNQAQNAVQDVRNQTTTTVQNAVAAGTDSARSVLQNQVNQTRDDLEQQAQQAAQEAKDKVRNLFGGGRGRGGRGGGGGGGG